MSHTTQHFLIALNVHVGGGSRSIGLRKPSENDGYSNGQLLGVPREAAKPYVLTRAAGARLPRHPNSMFRPGLHNGEAFLQEQVEPAITNFFNDVHEELNDTFQGLYHPALHAHAAARRVAHPIAAGCARQVLRHTPYVHANLTARPPTSCTTQITTHVDGRNQTLWPILFIPYKIEIGESIFGFPGVGRFGTYIPTSTKPCIVLADISVPHGTCNTEPVWPSHGNLYGIELSVSDKLL